MSAPPIPLPGAPFPFPMVQSPPTLSRADLQAYAVKRRAELANGALMRIRNDVLNAATSSATSYSTTTADIRKNYGGHTDQLAVITDDDFLVAFKTVFHDSDVTLADGTISVSWA